MIDGAISLLPFYEKKSGGGYSYACVYDGRDARFFGALGSQSFIFDRVPTRQEVDVYIHAIGEWLIEYMERDLPDRLNTLVMWDISVLAPILINGLLDRGFENGKTFAPDPGQVSYIETESATLFLDINLGEKKRVRILSLKSYLASSTYVGMTAALFAEKIAAVPVVRWSVPEDEAIRRLQDEASYLYMIANDMGHFHALLNEPTAISAATVGMSNFKRILEKKTEGRVKFKMLFMPSMLPEDEKAMLHNMDVVFANNKATAVCYVHRHGMIPGVTCIDINSAYGYAMTQDLPFGPILEDEPEGEHVTIVFPSGFYELREGGLPLFTVSTSFGRQHYHFEQDFIIGEDIRNFALDGTLPFLAEEWELLREQYNVVGPAEKIEKKYIKTIKNEYLKGYIETLYNRTVVNPRRKKYWKSEIVGIFGKFIQNSDMVQYVYHDDEHGVRQRTAVTNMKKPSYVQAGWYIAAFQRVRILRAIKEIQPEDLVYVDTDQIYCTNFEKYDKKFRFSEKIGDWKKEFENCDFNMFQKKKYQVRYPDGSVMTKCSGLPQEVQASLGFGDLDYGLEKTVWSRERDPVTFVLKPVPKKIQISDEAVYMRMTAQDVGEYPI